MGPKVGPMTGACRLRRCKVRVFLSPGGGVLSRGTVVIDGISDSEVDGRKYCAVVVRVRSTFFAMVDDGMVGGVWGEAGY